MLRGCAAHKVHDSPGTPAATTVMQNVTWLIVSIPGKCAGAGNGPAGLEPLTDLFGQRLPANALLGDYQSRLLQMCPAVPGLQELADDARPTLNPNP